ncbi:hypothetical protein [Rhizobiales bacterium]|uniref:hypothetical protein n=1 Tax=Pararhizobium sp. PWRC1-1 TaxID=2804566 RepID=UPI000DDF10AA
MSNSDTSKWDFDDNGKMTTQGLVEWGVASVLGQIVLRIGYVRSQREHEIYNGTDQAPHQIQVSLSSSAAKELSMQLSRYAEWMDLKLPAEPSPKAL